VRSGPTSFDDLVCHLPGVYPTDARAALDRVHAAGAITQAQLAQCVQRRPMRLLPRPSPNLPVPHPLDFDWRFTPEAVDALIAEYASYVGDTAPVVCVAAPSLHERLAADDKPTTLIDANQDMIASLAPLGADAICARVGSDPLPTLTAAAVVIDPPWYPAHVDLFLWAAAQFCGDDGLVLLSFPPAGTRPGVADERDAALRFAAGLGLSLIDIRRGELGYRSPPFERLALAAAGLDRIPEDWRRGDLLALRASASHHPAVRPSPVTDDLDWTAVPAPPTRIKVKHASTRPKAAPVQPRLNSIIDGDILPTVSRRDPRRSTAAVWTACNRVFACADTAAFATIVSSSARPDNAVEAIADAVGRRLSVAEQDEVKVATDQLEALVCAETRDLEECGWFNRPE
ncbi:MAG: hypothetical protein Q8K63_02860, partial [Acidimicrobiales bacterium]|nr:hypothetical protein [Acidimicrobiales bacterium]